MAEEQLDEELVSRAQKGDRSAFDVLVRRYQYKIVQLVERLVGEADGLDVAQESFIKAYRALNGFRGQSAFYTWLYRIAINTSKNFLVGRKRRPAAQDIDVADAELLRRHGVVERVGEQEAVERALAQVEEADDGLKLGLGATVQGGSFHVATDPRPGAVPAPRLDDTFLDYREIRVGLAAD